MEKSSEDITNKLLRSEHSKGLRNVFIGELVLGIVWGILGQVISQGTLTAVVNIIFLLISIFMAFSMIAFLRYWFSPFVSGAISALVWVMIFGVLRGFF